MRKEGTAEVRTRITWIDLVRGVAIVLVVLGHIITNGQSSGILQENLWLKVHDIVYSFHMPLFFFISGYLAKYVKEEFKTNTKRFLRKEICLIIPYVVFSFLYLTSKVLFAGSCAVVHSTSLSELFYIGIKPIGEYWFLYALIVFNIVGYMIDVINIISKGKEFRFLLLIIWIIGIAYSFTRILGDISLSGLSRCLPYLHYYIAGNIVKEFRLIHEKILNEWVSLGLGLISVILLYYKLFRGLSNNEMTIFTAYIIISFIISVFAQCECKSMEYIGSNTMPIYLLHVFTIVVFKICWDRLNLNAEVLFVFFSTIISVAMPLIVYEYIIAKIKPMDFLIYPGSYLPKV